MRDKHISFFFFKVQCFPELSTDHLPQSHPKYLVKMLVCGSISRLTGPEPLEVGLGICFFFFFLNSALVFLMILWVD